MGLHHQKGNTLFGLEVQFWLPSQPSNKCGSRNRSMMNLVLALFTENALNLYSQFVHPYQRRYNHNNFEYNPFFHHLNNNGSRILPSYHVFKRWQFSKNGLTMFLFFKKYCINNKHIDQFLKMIKHIYSYYWKSGIAVHLARVIKRYQI